MEQTIDKEYKCNSCEKLSDYMLDGFFGDWFCADSRDCIADYIQQHEIRTKEEMMEDYGEYICFGCEDAIIKEDISEKDDELCNDCYKQFQENMRRSVEGSLFWCKRRR